MLEVRDRGAWRQWLGAHHADVSNVWLVFHRKHAGIASIPYDDAVEEALCFGWIDSLVRRVDDNRYVRKFTPRRPDSVWSPTNKARAERMIATGRMTEVGQKLIDHAKASGEWAREASRDRPPADQLPAELELALAANPNAASFFHALAPSHRRRYILWIATAKRPETRTRRALEAIDRLARGEQLGLK